MFSFAALASKIPAGLKTGANFLVIGVLLTFVVLTKIDARHWQKKYNQCYQNTLVSVKKAADASEKALEKVTVAQQGHTERLVTQHHIVLDSRKDSDSYDQTVASTVRCRDPERVRAIDDLDARLSDSPAASSGPGAVHPDTPAPTE